jgi:hypothetical protein
LGLLGLLGLAGKVIWAGQFIYPSSLTMRQLHYSSDTIKSLKTRGKNPTVKNVTEFMDLRRKVMSSINTPKARATGDN